MRQAFIHLLTFSFLLSTTGTEALAAGWSTTGPSGGRITRLAQDPTHAGRWFVGTADHGAFRSDDDGAHWSAIDAGSSVVNIVAIKPDSGAPFVGTQRPGVVSGTLSRSLDGGTKFTSLLALGDAVTAIAFDPTLSTRWYVAGQNTGLFRTIDDGAHFVGGFVTGSGSCNVKSSDPFIDEVQVDATARVWVLVDRDVQRSADACASFDVLYGSLASGATNDGLSLAVDRSRTGVAYIGTKTTLLQTLDDGKTWQDRHLPGPVTRVVVGPGSNVWAVTGTGVQRSVDGGARFDAVGSGLGVDGVNDVGFGKDATSAVLAGKATGGVFSWSESKANWSISSAGIPAVARSVAVAPNGEVFAGTRGSGVYRAATGGLAWSPIDEGLGDLDVLTIASPVDGVLYATTSTLPLVTRTSGTWAASASGLPARRGTALAVDRSEPKVIYVGVAGSGLFRSSDAGSTWLPASVGLDTSHDVSGIAIAPSDPKHVWVATSGGGVFESSDRGLTFAPRNGPVTPSIYAGSIQFARTIAVDLRDPTRVWLGASGGGGLMTRDDGATWSGGTRTDRADWLQAVSVAPLGVVYAGGRSVGVGMAIGRSVDGITFDPFADGLGASDVVAIATDPVSGIPYAATDGEGVWSFNTAAVDGGTSDADATIDSSDAAVDLGGEASSSDGGIDTLPMDTLVVGDAASLSATSSAGCGCSTAGTRGGGVLALAAVGGAVLLIARRRRGH